MATMEGWSIPRDLIISEILLRLPVTSLVRFRSVCKAWYFETSKRRFIELHRERAQPNICRLNFSCVDDDDTSPIKIERLTGDRYLPYCRYRLPWLQDHGIGPLRNTETPQKFPWSVPKRYLITSSRHLIVLEYKYGYIVSNPAMQQLLYLPPAGTGWNCIGFGFVSSVGKYKVVSVNIDDVGICNVFTVGMDKSWRKGKPPPFPICPSVHMPCLNGNLHMMSSDFIHFEDSMHEIWRVLVFNLEEEEWSVIELPDDVQNTYDISLQLSEIRGLLYFMCCSKKRVIDVWVMRDYGTKVWYKEFVIDGRSLGAVKGRLPYGFPIEVMNDGRMFVEMDDGRWFYYDPRDGSFELAGFEGPLNTIYAENLVPVLGF
ncbi:hypothetical protein ACP70R_027734 [Stipagrostis hirtigluma subsp. patula]